MNTNNKRPETPAIVNPFFLVTLSSFLAMKNLNIPTMVNKNSRTEMAPKIRLTSVISVLINDPVLTPSEVASAFSPLDDVWLTKTNTKTMKNSNAKLEQPVHP